MIPNNQFWFSSRSKTSPTPIGTIINNDFNSSNWTQLGSNATFNNNGSQITISGGVGVIGDYYYYNKYYTCMKKWTQVWNFKTTVSGTAGAFGIVPGLQSFNTANPKNQWTQFITDNSGSNGKITDFSYGTTSGSALTYANGDNLQLTIDRNFDTFTATIINLTNPNSTVTYTFTFDFYSTSGTFIEPNRSALVIHAFGGTQVVTGFNFSTTLNKNVKTIGTGDSKTAGFYAGNRSNTFCSILGIDNYGGGSNTTADIVALLPELLLVNPSNVILQIGRNDLSLSIPTLTWQTNYNNIVNTLQAVGIKVYHQLPLPEGGATPLDQSPLTNFINSNFPSNRIISVPSSWNTATDLSTDNIHPNASGNSKIASNTSTTYPSLI